MKKPLDFFKKPPLWFLLVLAVIGIGATVGGTLFMTQESLSAYVTEWTTLKGLYDGRVKMIIPPTRKNIDFNNGLLTDGDGLLSVSCFGYQLLTIS